MPPRRKTLKRNTAKPELKTASRKRRNSWVLLVLLVIVVGVWRLARQKSTAVPNAAVPALASLQQLLSYSPEQLETVDIALMNLRCAEGLRGSEELDVAAALGTLDRYAKHVEQETTRHQYRFKKNPAEFENSEPYFRMMMMAMVLQQDFSIRYNAARIPKSDSPEENAKFCANSKDVFIHGMIGPPSTGTCSSMPVLHVAIGRRLGYPLYLAAAKGHLYVRWEDSRSHLNVEATSEGFLTRSDEHYRSWPRKVDDAEIAANGLLRSMTPTEELACFMSARGACLYDGRGHYLPGIAAHREALRLAPHIRTYRIRLDMACERLADLQFEQTKWLLDHEGQNVPYPPHLAPRR